MNNIQEKRQAAYPMKTGKPDIARLKIRKRFFLLRKNKWVLAAFAAAIILFGCSDGGGDEDEFNDEDADVTDQVVSSSANKAGLHFMATPDIPKFAEQIENARANGFVWSVGNWAQIPGSSTNFITGKTNQLAAAGSGFQFTLNTKAANADTLRPAIRFNAMFYFTADNNNLGSDTYPSLRAALEALPNHEGWVMPESSVLTDLGIKVFTTYNNKPQDITDRISFGLMVDEGKILISYGAVMVDRAISDFSQEGRSLLVSDEEELIWSDGAADNMITAAWWIGKANDPARYKPGVYTSSANGFNGNIKVSVSFSEEKISSITIDEHNETIGRSKVASAIKSIPDAIVQSQSLEVDVVSGATYTSKAIKDAVKKCVLEATKDT
ncbi:MAG: FMN-binding protein [Spirochaetaceae bacterium]|jgi:uncharacterized protein with FMN-binding domain|nr:FMN-binding protein [Spirochaetaceae bacterium]